MTHLPSHEAQLSSYLERNPCPIAFRKTRAKTPNLPIWMGRTPQCHATEATPATISSVVSDCSKELNDNRQLSPKIARDARDDTTAHDDRVVRGSR